MVNYVCSFNQSATVKYFEWIIMIIMLVYMYVYVLLYYSFQASF